MVNMDITMFDITESKMIHLSYTSFSKDLMDCYIQMFVHRVWQDSLYNHWKYSFPYTFKGISLPEDMERKYFSIVFNK